MTSTRRLAVTAIAAACAMALPALAAAAAPAGARVWVAGATEKIRPDAAARSDAVARIAAARNEFEAFQVVVTGAAKGVSAVASPLQTAGGAVIPAGNVRLYREAIITLQRPSSADGARGKWPDALVPDVDDVVGEKRNAFPFDVGAGQSAAIWVDVLVPPDAAAAAYTGQVTVSFGTSRIVVPVELTVWDFTLPSTSTLRTAFNLYWGDLWKGHGFSSTDYVTFAAVRARYGQLALDHRVTLPAHDDGLWADLGHFEAAYGPLVDGTAPTRLAGARLTSVQYLGGLTDSAKMAEWVTLSRARGWFDRLFQYTCDEPPQNCAWSDLVARASAAKAADPGFRTLVTTSIQKAQATGDPTYPDVSSWIDLLTPVVNFMDDKSGAYAGPQRPAYDAFLSHGPPKELWLYQSCMSHDCGGSSTYGTGWPSYMIDASAVRNRAMQWLDFRYGATGELYWETTYAFYNATDAWTNQYFFTGNGDGTLFYPGTPAKIGGTSHVPVASIRLKMIREGMEDYEYLALVARADPAFAQAEVAALFPHPYATEIDPAALMASRERLARRVLELRAAGLLP